MLISEVIDLAKEAELKQLSIKDNKPAIIGFINMGVLELYKRFNLSQDEAIITVVDAKTVYTLEEADPDVDITLTDHDFLFVSEVYDETGDLLTLNDEKDPYSLTTPKYNQLEIATISVGAQYSVIYRSAPKFSTNEKAVLPLPPQFLEALLHYIGWRGHGSVKGDIKSENNTHYTRFDNSCKRILTNGLINQDDLVSNNFETRGFA